MTYREAGPEVTLTMTRADYGQLLLLLGFAVGSAARQGDRELFYASIDFVNRLNAGNPRYQAYRIPEEYQA